MEKFGEEDLGWKEIKYTSLHNFNPIDFSKKWMKKI